MEMRMDRATQARIESLLFEVRGWAEGTARPPLAELARRFRLDPLIVQRILESEGIEVEGAEATSADAASSARPVTAVLNPEDVAAAQRRASGEDEGA
jgi:hypothetical protein